ncbi:MAG: bifunctional DNA-formamidopyrimidine glycosylase/DNA-(apurinic or apyrimidinic site) lyase [Candidatus Taylorbacteria bacterium]|nr:bifunctional DNA-formamidopyrimidine glycosylase/DNA-(apurinic or apyrimidinic site) lyase [Candidatus Taylorbacteria bacterium]
MPELPEVETTVNGLNRAVRGLKITGVWTDYGGAYHRGKQNIKDQKYFKEFRRRVMGAALRGAERLGKNVVLKLSNGRSIVIHMKMTGHLLYGTYSRRLKIKNQKSKIKEQSWEPIEPESLKDPYNRFIHLVFTLSNGRHLAFSDMRKFGKVFVCRSEITHCHPDLEKLGPDPLSPATDLKLFKERLKKRPNAPIKPVLMDQTVLAGIGNIYSDEILWLAGLHPLTAVKKISGKKMRKLHLAMKSILKKGMRFGGDSMSDYRNLEGEPGRFQNEHRAYRLTGKKCQKPNCPGTIRRLKIGGRSAHFCDKHQSPI